MLLLDLWAQGLGEDGARELMTIRFVCGDKAAGKQKTRYLHRALLFLMFLMILR